MLVRYTDKGITRERLDGFLSSWAFWIRKFVFYLLFVRVLARFKVVSELFPIRTKSEQNSDKSGQTRTLRTCVIEPFQTIYYSKEVCKVWCFPAEVKYANVKSCINSPTIITRCPAGSIRTNFLGGDW